MGIYIMFNLLQKGGGFEEVCIVEEKKWHKTEIIYKHINPQLKPPSQIVDFPKKLYEARKWGFSKGGTLFSPIF